MAIPDGSEGPWCRRGGAARLARERAGAPPAPAFATVPTVADLRARRLDVTRASIRERLIAGELDDVRVVVAALAEEFDVLDIAAAAVKLAHAAAGGDGEEQEIAAVEPPARRGARDGERGEKRGPFDGHGVRLYIGAGRRAGIRPADLVGAITGEAGVPSRPLGAIELADRFSLVEVPDELADDIIAAMRKSMVRGQKVTVRREGDS